ncbi:striated muscle preferentially expressed protein kinase [Impatiens glandulifera]|uniref:striated muscle preferentially expressed protein kinase n=1 Tax=Impatiens glandulifera TaxID=253017 RepID=UPI001FB0C8AA|nr:striated muscle preferentially expressed protein kinase [Impatiens glandulifera]
MGSCFSTIFKPTASAPPPPPSNHQRLSDVRSDIPYQAESTAPPLPPEEESVKEVLSETPLPKSQTQIPKIESPQDNKRVNWPPAIEKVVPKPTIVPSPAEETSEMSDLCSVSESVSAMSTATATEEGEVRQRSPAKFRNRLVAGQRNNAVGKSPMRRSTQPSPGRVQTGVRDRQKRDLGEISGRRSRSPATRVAGGDGVVGGGRKPGLSRSPSGRRAGKSPGRARSDPEKCPKQEEPANNEDKWPPTVKESLENPLVSLECFIFL